MRTLLRLGLLSVSAIAVPSAGAAVTVTDLQVAGRALGFLEAPFTGAARVGIVHDPENTRSARQAQQIEEMLSGGLRIGDLELTPVMVPLHEADAADIDLFFLTEHLDPNAVPLAAISAARKIPCLTTDIAQVRSGACIVGIRTNPKIEILVNRAASVASGMTFATVFRVMITEL